MNKVLIGLLGLAVVVGIWYFLATPGEESSTVQSDATPSETVAAVDQVVEEVAAAIEETPALAPEGNPIVVMETNQGRVVIELWADRAPLTVANFLRYIDNGFYNDLIFHRVIPNFMIQGGGFNSEMFEQSTYAAIKNEATPELMNNRGTLAMARTNVVDSATSQFFINLVDNAFLNHTDTTPSGYGYAVFGQVIEGMEVVDEIATVETGNARGHQNVPVEPVIMTSITRQ